MAGERIRREDTILPLLENQVAIPADTRDAALGVKAATEDLVTGLSRLDSHVVRMDANVVALENVLRAFSAASDRSARWMIWLTAALVVLTVAIVALTVVLVLNPH